MIVALGMASHTFKNRGDLSTTAVEMTMYLADGIKGLGEVAAQVGRQRGAGLAGAATAVAA